jgi:short-subunit dehydrogenase
VADSFRGKQALVTGGSSGIGLDIARLLLAEGADVCILGSSAQRLEEATRSLEKETLHRPSQLVCDLSDTGAVRKIPEILSARAFVPQVLVNNAGFGIYGMVVVNEPADVRRMIEVNVQALTALTLAFLPGMKKNGWGRILNVASTAAFQPVPVEALYAASKSFVLSFTEALADELGGTGVTATCLCPGPTKTPFFEKNGFLRTEAVKGFFMDSAPVAKTGVEAMRSGKTLAVAGFRNRSIPFFERFVPRRTVVKIARKMVE